LKRLLVIMFVLAALMSVAFASPADFLATLEPYADHVNDAGLYASVFLAQAILETGWGSSEAVRYHNLWGIKCRAAPCFSKTTWEVYAGQVWQGQLLFQAYPDLAAGVQGYCDKINYQAAYQDVDRTTRDTFIDTLARHWATDPYYADKLRHIISIYGLGKYDAEAE